VHGNAAWHGVLYCRQVRKVLAEADENEDDVIQYKEFLPVMVDILQSIKVRWVLMVY
jgi:hypothetical protein